MPSTNTVLGRPCRRFVHLVPFAGADATLLAALAAGLPEDMSTAEDDEAVPNAQLSIECRGVWLDECLRLNPQRAADPTPRPDIVTTVAVYLRAMASDERLQFGPLLTVCAGLAAAAGGRLRLNMVSVGALPVCCAGNPRYAVWPLLELMRDRRAAALAPGLSVGTDAMDVTVTGDAAVPFHAVAAAADLVLVLLSAVVLHVHWPCGCDVTATMPRHHDVRLDVTPCATAAANEALTVVDPVRGVSVKHEFDRHAPLPLPTLTTLLLRYRCAGCDRAAAFAAPTCPHCGLAVWAAPSGGPAPTVWVDVRYRPMH